MKIENQTAEAQGWRERRSPVVAWIVGVVWLMMSIGIAAAAEGAEPTPASCVTAKCHEKMGKASFVHVPVAAGMCTFCHNQPNPAKHAFKDAQKGADLCYMCHPRKDTKAVVHAPVKAGQCSFCHDPHQSQTNKFRLKIEPPVKLCFTCHQDNMTSQKFVHGPVAAGACTVCHNPHESSFPFRTEKKGNDLCLMCHTDKAETLLAKKYTHPPVKERCTNCHSPHGTPHEFQLKAAVPALCFGCHKDKEQYVAAVRTKHEALSLGKSCVNCHDPHVADLPKQLAAAPMDLCFKCHDKELDTPTGKIINMKKWVEENPIWHGPIKQKDCAACHNPHGSDNFRILKKFFPREFYTSFEVEKYALCFNCHEQTLVLDPQTTTLTGFRNGDANLHFKHVNKMEKGRTCRACHELHASKRPKRMREGVPFGAWEIPINYEKTKTGGRCAPGCHVPRGYDRDRAVVNR